VPRHLLVPMGQLVGLQRLAVRQIWTVPTRNSGTDVTRAGTYLLLPAENAKVS
jgi:hypothetical protein